MGVRVWVEASFLAIILLKIWRGAPTMAESACPMAMARANIFFFFITLKPRVESHTKSMRLEYEPASEPLHIYVKSRESP